MVKLRQSTNSHISLATKQLLDCLPSLLLNLNNSVSFSIVNMYDWVPTLQHSVSGCTGNSIHVSPFAARQANSIPLKHATKQFLLSNLTSNIQQKPFTLHTYNNVNLTRKTKTSYTWPVVFVFGTHRF